MEYKELQNCMSMQDYCSAFPDATISDYGKYCDTINIQNRTIFDENKRRTSFAMIKSRAN